MATSIITCGFSLGVLIFNPLTYLLISKIGWNFTFTVQAGIVGLGVGFTSLTFADISEFEEESTEGYDEIVEHMTSIGISQAIASLGMVIIYIGEFLSRLLTALLGDKLKGKFLLLYTILTSLLSIISFFGSYTYNYTTVILYASAIGLFDGPIFAAMMTSCYELYNGEHLKETSHIMKMGMGIGYLIGPPLAGLLHETRGSFKPVFYGAAILYLVASILYGICLCLKSFKKIR
ncbi:DgyrCDS1381 [Dimorphilus gyrociliatus]|uniref:DgyrCDS1381 n=1 Tax=Dimorphilus gyrociliatus TaxID=2664684 RepID=A0A7I8V984_9ANNE|nr:DgyrCDS1381 [Dimorphilus gyrociliatus]